MAVVSISRIQVRRGTANQGTGLPQLASGEFGWAIDTQELYIGNGSTSEGAPAVGNTRILTERTNVLDLAGQYTYNADGNIETSEASDVSRTIAARLDDRVSVRAFGLYATSSPDIQTQQLQKALYELYLNDQTAYSEYVLHVEPGRYIITETIYVPPFTTIIGAGKDQTIFTKNGNYPLFETISSDSFYNGSLESALPSPEPQFLETNQSQGVRLEHVTLETVSNSVGTKVALLRLQSTKDSMFNHVRFKGQKTTGDSDEVAIELNSKSNLVRTRDNIFSHCEFIGLGFAAYSESNIVKNIFDQCKFVALKAGVVLGNNLIISQDGPESNTIMSSTFDDIDEYAYLIPSGTKNASVRNIYGFNVGAGGANSSASLFPIISYGETGNTSEGDVFRRTYGAAIDPININGITYPLADGAPVPSIGDLAAPYYPEIEGPCYFTWGFTEQFTVNNAGVNSPLLKFRLPADATKAYTVDYFYTSTFNADFTREGSLEINVNRLTNTVAITDDYAVSGNTAFNEAIKFTGEIAYVIDTVGNEVYAANIYIENPGDEGPMTIKVTSKS
jgi:hypothetical protein